MNLRIPGPTPCPDEVLRAAGRQMINHRGPEFASLLREVTAKLKGFFETQGDVLIFTGSGTAGLEAAVVNTLSPGDRVLSLCNGYFGDRFADIATAYGAAVTRLEFDWGSAVDPEAVGRALAADPSIKAVLVTHNETSTGLTNDLAAISTVVKGFDKLFVVDAISSLGCIDLPTDEWRCDVVVCGSQKGWMVPPGLVFVSVNERAWKAAAEAKMPRYYLDFAQAKRYVERGETPFTPAVSIFFALGVALEMMEREGLPNIIARHARVAQRAREGVRSLGLGLFPDERYASNTVTAVRVPEGVDASKLLKMLREEHGVVLASGQQILAGKIFRIGHLGYVSESDIDGVLYALSQVLPAVGMAVPRAPAIRGM